uniref:Transthyretin-like family protein n=1 Tax=Steinernema glaseri TaxID=37863 RepID=A0A1I8A6U6_9BILA
MATVLLTSLAFKWVSSLAKGPYFFGYELRNEWTTETQHTSLSNAGGLIEGNPVHVECGSLAEDRLPKIYSKRP